MLEPPLLKVHGLAFAVMVNSYVRFNAVVRHRQQINTDVPALAQGCRHIAECVASIEHLRANQMGGKVSISQAKPCGPGTVGRQLTMDGERVVCASPTPLVIDAATEGVHHRV